MKIDTTNIIQTLGGEPGRGRPGDASFGSFLDQALNSLQTGDNTVRNPPPTQYTLPVFVNQPQDKDLQQKAMDHAGRILAGLDDYQSRLGNSSNTLKEVGASLERLEDEVRQMAPMLDQLEEGDPLLDILQSVSGLAMVEAIKFRRGDYS